MNERDVADAIAERLSSGHSLVAIGGPVAVGKSTIAAAVAACFREDGLTVRVVSSDAFLLSNEVLAGRDLVMRKGFPETYDVDTLTVFAAEIRAGRPVDIPVYSHETYDLTAERERVEPSDVVIVEGIIVTQTPVVGAFDVSVYIDAPEASNRAWFVERFLRFVDTGRSEPASFYHAFAAMDADGVCGIAEATWDAINGVNLHEHIGPSIANADLVVRKASDHSIEAVDVLRS